MQFELFAGHQFEILCGDACDNKANPNGCAVPPAGVIGYDFWLLPVIRESSLEPLADVG